MVNVISFTTVFTIPLENCTALTVLQHEEVALVVVVVGGFVVVVVVVVVGGSGV